MAVFFNCSFHVPLYDACRCFFYRAGRHFQVCVTIRFNERKIILRLMKGRIKFYIFSSSVRQVSFAHSHRDMY